MLEGSYFLLLLGILLNGNATCHVVRGLKTVSKTFIRKAWFQAPKTIYALQNVTVDFADGITALCGSSGSGKSTIAKLVNGQYPQSEYGGDIDVVDITTSQIPTVYLDPFYYLTYDSTKTVGHYLDNQETLTVLYEIMNKIFDIPYTSVINNLLESQRKFFEILLLFYRLSRVRSDNAGLLIFDEYLDKDMPSVRSILFSKLRTLCENKELKFQVIIVTHSKAVCNSCDTVIALKNGIVYSDGAPAKVMKYLPAEFVLLQ